MGDWAPATYRTRAPARLLHGILQASVILPEDSNVVPVGVVHIVAPNPKAIANLRTTLKSPARIAASRCQFGGVERVVVACHEGLGLELQARALSPGGRCSRRTSAAEHVMHPESPEVPRL